MADRRSYLPEHHDWSRLLVRNRFNPQFLTWGSPAGVGLVAGRPGGGSQMTVATEMAT